MRADRRRFVAAAIAAASEGLGGRTLAANWLHPPLFRRPVPSAAQLRWQREELALFLHFGVNTFTDREWGDGTESPALFDPDALDARAWARIARATGFRALILTAKHHDGFCLWPTATTRHSVAASPWRAGAGDVVREVSEAARAEGLGFGLYLSPWDRHEPRYGDSPAYMTFYLAQLEELCTRYGPLSEVWFDGANAEGPSGRKQVYDWPRIHALVRRLQPGAVIFSDAGPDVRWIGNERGVAGETCWSTIDPEAVPYAGYDAPRVGEILQRGTRDGSVWRPGETDVSIRPGWFHHAAEDARVKTPDALLDLYETSVGRNSKLLLNVPPDRHGQLDATDVASLEGFDRLRRARFATDLASGAWVTATSSTPGRDPRAVVEGDRGVWWEARTTATSATLELRLSAPSLMSAIRLAEPIALGQTIESFSVHAVSDDRARLLAEGTTVGYGRIVRVSPTVVRRLRVTVRSTIGPIRLATFSLHHGATP